MLSFLKWLENVLTFEHSLYNYNFYTVYQIRIEMNQDPQMIYH